MLESTLESTEGLSEEILVELQNLVLISSEVSILIKTIIIVFGILISMFVAYMVWVQIRRILNNYVYRSFRL